MVAKCSYAFSFATESSDAFFLESSSTIPEMVTFEADNSSNVSSSNNCVILNDSCQAVSSDSAAASNGCSHAGSSSVSIGFHMGLSGSASDGCLTEAAADDSSVPCTEKPNDSTAVKEGYCSDGIESCITKLPDVAVTLVKKNVSSCRETDATTSEFSLLEAESDINTETDLILKTKDDNKGEKIDQKITAIKACTGITTFTGKDQQNDASIDKEGNSSQWGDPPVLDNSVLWDSLTESKEGVDQEVMLSKTFVGIQPLDCQSAVLWDKPPSLIKIEQQEKDSDLDDSKKLVDQHGSRRWLAVSCIGAGLQNLGNTCFVNATLQCLTYTPPLVNYLLAEKNSTSCRVDGLCLMCELGRHMTQCFQNSGAVIKPHSILQKLKVIAKHMRWGRQEDAHEFLRYMVDAMNKSCISGHQVSLDNSKETIVNKIFGGYLCSQVTCLECKAESNTYDPFLDLSLDVKNVSSILIALQKFVQPETLDNDNAYDCTKCKQKVCAQKRFSIHRLSNILTIQLKRYGVMGGKVTRHITFPELLDVRPFMSKVNAGALIYQLYGVLVHDGHSTNSGHYYCYVMTAKGDWYCMNDHMVRRSSLSQVLNAEAYLLLYIRQPSSSPGPSDGVNLTNGSPDENSPIHRGAVIDDGQQLDAMMTDDVLISKKRVMCRGGQLPRSFKKGLFASKMKSVLAGSKPQYSKTMQRKVKHRKTSNVSAANIEKKASKMFTKKPNETLPLNHSFVEETCNELSNCSPLFENQTVVSGPELTEKTGENLTDSVIVGLEEQNLSIDDKSKAVDKPKIFKNKLKLDENHQIYNDIRVFDSIANSEASQPNDYSDSVEFTLKATGKLSLVSKKAKQNVELQKAKKNSSENDEPKSTNVQLAFSEFVALGENSKIFSRTSDFSVADILPNSKQLKDNKRPVMSNKFQKMHENTAKSPQNVEREIERHLTSKSNSAAAADLVRNNQTNIVMNAVDVDNTAVGIQGEKTNCPLPRIVLKIKQGQVLLEDSSCKRKTDSFCSVNVTTNGDGTANKRGSNGIAITNAKSKALSTQKLSTKTGKNAKMMFPRKHSVLKGKGLLGQAPTAKKPLHLVIDSCSRSRTLNQMRFKRLSHETTDSVSLKENGDDQNDDPGQLTLKSRDVYDFNGVSDDETFIREMPARRSPKIGLLKSASSPHCAMVDGELNATTVVPGLNIPLDRNPRAFCPRSHQSEKKLNAKQRRPSSEIFRTAEDTRSVPVKNFFASSRPLINFSESVPAKVSCPELETCNPPLKTLHRPKLAATVRHQKLHTTLNKNRIEVKKSEVDRLDFLQTAGKLKSREKIQKNSQPDADMCVLNACGPSDKRPVQNNEYSSVNIISKNCSRGACPDAEIDDSVFRESTMQSPTGKISDETDLGVFCNAHQLTINQLINPALCNGVVGKRTIARRDHRKCEKRRQRGGKAALADGSKARDSLKRKAKFSGTYNETEMPCAFESQQDRSETRTRLSSSNSDDLALTSIKLKIRKVSTSEDGASIYRVVPSSNNEFASISAHGSGSSFDRCRSLDSGSTEHSINSAGKFCPINERKKLSIFNPTDHGHGKSPFNNQVREQRNIFQNLEEAVMHSREEFTRQTGLGWSKVDEAGLRQTEPDVKTCESFNHQDFTMLNSFNWTTLLNHSVPNDTGQA